MAWQEEIKAVRFMNGGDAKAPALVQVHVMFSVAPNLAPGQSLKIGHLLSCCSSPLGPSGDGGKGHNEDEGAYT